METFRVFTNRDSFEKIQQKRVLDWLGDERCLYQNLETGEQKLFVVATYYLDKASVEVIGYRGYPDWKVWKRISNPYKVWSVG